MNRTTSIRRLLDIVETRQRLPEPVDRRRIRQAAGLTLEEIGDALTVSADAVRLWELGARRPSNRYVATYVALLESLASTTERLRGER